MILWRQMPEGPTTIHLSRETKARLDRLKQETGARNYDEVIPV